MDGDIGRGFTRSSPRRGLTQSGTTNWLIMGFSAAGVLCILLGLLALAIPASKEGAIVWQVDSRHTVYMMDAAGLIASAMGVFLTWLSGKLWQHRIKP
jgi:hypothetical protein